MIKYTSPEWSHQLEAALRAWEFAAAAVLERERVVVDLERLAGGEAAEVGGSGLEDNSNANDDADADTPLTAEVHPKPLNP